MFNTRIYNNLLQLKISINYANFTLVKLCGERLLIFLSNLKLSTWFRFATAIISVLRKLGAIERLLHFIIKTTTTPRPKFLAKASTWQLDDILGMSRQTGRLEHLADEVVSHPVALGVHQFPEHTKVPSYNNHRCTAS